MNLMDVSFKGNCSHKTEWSLKLLYGSVNVLNIMDKNLYTLVGYYIILNSFINTVW